MSLSRSAFRPVTLLAVLGLAVSSLAACGDQKPDRKALLSSSSATELRSSLDGVEQMVDDGDCAGAGTATIALRDKVDALPSSVDTSLRTALSRSANRLQTLVEQRCEPAGATGTTTPSTTPPEGPTQPEEGGPKKPKKPKKQKKEKVNKKKPEEQQNPGEDGTQTSPEDQSGGAAP
jgi:outer membrane biosynthesis protein TonB